MKVSKRMRGGVASKLTNVALALVLVLGMSPATKAVAASNAAGTQAADQAETVVDDATPGKTDAAAGATAEDGSSVDAVADSGKAPDGGNADSNATGSNENAVSAGENTLKSFVASSLVQSNENSIMLADVDSSDTYNEKADYREVTTGLSVGLYKDSNYSQELGSEAITTDTTVYGKLSIDFSQDEKPTLSQPNIKYTFPNNVSFTNKPSQTLYDGNNNIAGTWEIKGGVAYLHYNENWLRNQANNITAHVSFDFTLAGNNQGDGKSVVVNFPGTATPVKINTKDGSVDASKFGADISKTWEMPSFDATDNSYTWTIKVSPKTYATGLKITDEIGSNLSFVDGSFKLVDQAGATVSGNLSVSYEGQKATISLGDLSAGDYYVQYKTQVKQSVINALKDNENLSNINNTIKWSWGTTPQQNGGPTSVDPQSVKYSMASKSASGTPDDITWTVTLNSGSLKADMSNYAFTDTLGDGQAFKSGTNYEVKDASGNTVATGAVDASSKELSFTLPSTAGKQQYTVTYHTQMTDTSSLDAVTNKVVVTPPDDSKYPRGEATGKYQPTDKGTYITKSLTKAIESASYDGVAEWKSQILFSDMSANTSANSIVFADHFTSLPSNATVKLTGDVTVAIDGGDTLEAGTDYVLTDNGEKGQWNDIFQITFKATDKVNALIGKSGAKVNVTYKTQTSKVNDAYPAGTYTNESTVKTDKKSAVSANASYDIESSTMPAVSKKSSTSTWDATYDWGDGEKGAWITEWEAHVNCDEPNTWTHQAASDLKGADVKLTDTLPEGMAYVAKSGQYSLVGASGFNSSWNQAVEPAVTGNQAVFTVKTSTVAKNSGTEANPVYSWKGYVTFKYKTAVKASAIEVGASKEFENSAQAQSGEKTFPAGSAKTTITNQVLDKNAARAADGSHVTFTIKVNPNALTIGSTGSLELEDIMNSGASFTSGSLHVKDAKTGAEVTEGVSYKLGNGIAADGSSTTVLTLTVPDSRALTVTYDVSPQGILGESAYISNDVSMNGFASASKKYGNYWQVAKSNAGTEGTSYGLTVTKTDDSGNKVLEGAEFALYKVDMDASTEGNIVKSLVTGVGDNPKTTGANGVAQFGTEGSPLESNVLYCYVETKAPTGYKISNTEPFYVMFGGTSEQDKKDLAEAQAKAKALGITPTISTSVSVYDSLADGSFKIHVSKGVSGTYEEDAAPTFTFTATATGDNAELAPKLSDVTITGAGETDFEGTLTKEMIGQAFTYELKEVVPAEVDRPAGWTYDDKTVTATVKVTSDGEKISAQITYSKDDESVNSAQFNNTYTAPKPDSTTASIKVTKTVNGGPLQEKEQFTFQLQDSSKEDIAGKTVTIKGTDEKPEATFTTPELDAAGTYTYYIHETSNLGDGWQNDGDIKVVVTTEAIDGKISVKSVEYFDGDQKIDAAKFDNTYTAKSAKGEVKVAKTVNGGPVAKGEKFTFTLLDQDKKQVSGTGEITADYDHQTVSFGELTFSKAGTYAYTVHETSDLGNGWTNDDDFPVTFTVNEGSDRDLHVTKVEYGQRGYEVDGSVVAKFDNKYEASGSATISVYKTVNGGTEAVEGEEFTFDLYKAGADGKATGDAIDSLSVKAGGTASFDAAKLGYTFADAGKTYKYVVHETGHNADGWVADSDATAVVKVTDNGDGTLKADVTYSRGTNAAAFDDKYDAAATATISVTKTVNGGTEAVEGEWFEFELLNKDGSKVEGVEGVKTQAGGTASFSGIAYTLADAGKTFTYRVHEVGHNDKGWTADSDVDVTVKVVKNADLTLSTEVTYSRGTNAAAFTNTYATSGELQVEISKTVNGGSMTSDKQFTFGLFETDDTGAKTGEAIATATVKAGQSAVLDDVFYDQDNAGETITYVISELGDLGEGWTKAADQKIAVTVTDNGDGTMTADVAYEGGASAAAFDNKYEEPKTPETPKTTTTDKTTTTGKTATATATKSSVKTGDPLAGALAAIAGLAAISGAAALHARRMRKRDR